MALANGPNTGLGSIMVFHRVFDPCSCRPGFHRLKELWTALQDWQGNLRPFIYDDSQMVLAIPIWHKCAARLHLAALAAFARSFRDPSSFCLADILISLVF